MRRDCEELKADSHSVHFLTCDFLRSTFALNMHISKIFLFWFERAIAEKSRRSFYFCDRLIAIDCASQSENKDFNQINTEQLD